MLLTDKITIKDVMLFPAMKPNEPIKGGDAAAGSGAAPRGGASSSETIEVHYATLPDKTVPDMITAFAGHKNVKMVQFNKDQQDKKFD